MIEQHIIDKVVQYTGHNRYRALTDPNNVSYNPAYVRKVQSIYNQIEYETQEPFYIDQWEYITTERLTVDTRTLMETLPANIDLIIAIARSGLLPGSLISYHLHLPLFSVSRQQGLQDLGHGVRLENYMRNNPRHILIIDDTVAGGKEMRNNYITVKDKFPNAKITKAVIYAHPMGIKDVDCYVGIYPGSHYLEWNWCNAGHGAGCVMDFDGIICHDCPVEDDDDGERYINFLNNVKPLYLPRRTVVPIVVTARREKYRNLTMNWLNKYGIRVQQLIMRDFEVNNWSEELGAWKASFYSDNYVLFAESEPEQAKVIQRITGKPVLCPQLKRVLYV